MLACLPPALAEPLEGQDFESRILSDRFYYRVGWFDARLSTDIGIGFGSNVGTFIRLEDDLDLDGGDSSVRIQAEWRFNRKHAIGFDWTQLDRSGLSVLAEEIEIEDPEGGDNGLRFGVGAVVNTELDNSIATVEYRFSFYNNGKIDAGIVAGLGIYDFDYDLVGAAVVINEDGTEIEGTGIRRANGSVTVPVPTFGIHLSYAFNPRLLFRFTTKALEIEFDDIEGRVGDNKGTFEYFVTRNVSLGAGFTSSSVDFKDLGRDPVQVDYRYGGLLVFVGAAF